MNALRSLAFAALLALPAANAVAQTAQTAPGIGAFFGSYYGAGITGTAPGGAAAATGIRDTSVEITPVAGGGFTLAWSAITHTGVLRAPKAKTTRVEFKPVQGTNEFEAARPPAPGGERYRARLEGATLIVESEGRTEDGRRESQRWERSLRGNIMELVYVRSVAGQPALSVRSSLARVGQ